MVKVVVLVEGSQPKPQTEAEQIAYIETGAVFREAYHKLLRKRFPVEAFDLEIRPIGSVRDAPRIVKEEVESGNSFVLLIDLDGPVGERQARLDANYVEEGHGRIFFMVQAMEAWILSQPSVIGKYAADNGSKDKRSTRTLDLHPLIKGKHPEDIQKPEEKLGTIMREHFVRERRGKEKAWEYKKTKDGPEMVGMLDYGQLEGVFSDVARLSNYLVP